MSYNYITENIKFGLKTKFHKTIKYRKRLKIESPIENGLMAENFNKLNRAEAIHIKNIRRGRKPFLLTVTPITKENRTKITSYLSRQKIPYFGNVEFTKKNAPHLHLTIYLENDNYKQIEKIEKKFNFSDQLVFVEMFDKKPISFDLRELKDLHFEDRPVFNSGWKYAIKILTQK